MAFLRKDKSLLNMLVQRRGDLISGSCSNHKAEGPLPAQHPASGHDRLIELQSAPASSEQEDAGGGALKDR